MLQHLFVTPGVKAHHFPIEAQFQNVGCVREQPTGFIFQVQVRHLDVFRVMRAQDRLEERNLLHWTSHAEKRR